MLVSQYLCQKKKGLTLNLLSLLFSFISAEFIEMKFNFIFNIRFYS